MLMPGARIIMTKGYKDVKGTIIAKMDSKLEFYLIKLENNIQIIAGPSAFNFE